MTLKTWMKKQDIKTARIKWRTTTQEDPSEIEEHDSQEVRNSDDSDDEDGSEENGMESNYDQSKAWRNKPVEVGVIPSFRTTKTGPTCSPN